MRPPDALGAIFMSGLIPQRFIEDLLERVDLSQLIGSRVPLRKAGNSFKACCPFHDEKTPSFNVRPDKGFYHCFGCGAHGDAISFLRDFDHLGFTEAVEELARQQGLEVPQDPVAREEVRHSRGLTEALEFACSFYRRQLREHPAGGFARDYLRQRGLSPEVVERFALGFAPPEGDALAIACDGPTRKALTETGTIHDRYGRTRDLLRNRIVFPIRNTRGKTLAFGGRTLGNDKAKYINSPESDIFHKSREIYGLHEAQQNTRQLDRLLVVEGYMDVIALAQFGIGFAVATLGTATNRDNISALLKQVRHLIFCFDGDGAGFRAAQKAMENSLELLQDGIHIQFLMLPEGEDPDTLIRQRGREDFDRRIEQAVPLSRFLFDRASEGLDLNLAEDRGELRARVEPLLRRMPRSTLNQAMWQEMARLCGSLKRESQWRGHGAKPESPQQPSPSIQIDQDRWLCLAMLYAPELSGALLELPGHDDLLPQATALASWIKDNQCLSTDDVVVGVALNPAAHERFQGLFDRMEHIPERDIVLADAREVLERVEKDQKKAQIRALLDQVQDPGQWSQQTKETLRSLARQKEAATEAQPPRKDRNN